MTRSQFALSVIGLLAGAAALAAGQPLLNLDKNGLALQGYDPTAFFTIKVEPMGSHLKLTFLARVAH